MIQNLLSLFVPYAIFVMLYVVYRYRDYIIYKIIVLGLWIMHNFFVIGTMFFDTVRKPVQDRVQSMNEK